MKPKLKIKVEMNVKKNRIFKKMKTLQCFVPGAGIEPARSLKITGF
jgi:hypothetical protein